MATVWTRRKLASDQRINQLLILKEAIEGSLQLEEFLQGMSSALLIELKETFGSPVVHAVKELLNTVIAQDCRWAQTAVDLRTQKCYAVVSETNGYLGVCRQLFEEYNSDIGEMVKEYSREHNVAFETRFDMKRGFVLRIKRKALGKDNQDGSQLADEFINKRRTSRYVECTTLEMMKCNTRISNVVAEIVLVSDQIVDGLLDRLQPHTAALFKLSECVAVLDLLVSFAALVSSSAAGYVRPQFSTSTPAAAVETTKLGIKMARHPILERTIKGRPFVPNDFYASPDTAYMNIITGGKPSCATGFRTF